MASTEGLLPITDDERRIVRNMLRFRALVTEQVARHLAGCDHQALDTLERLRELGVVQREPSWIACTELWTATPLGARLVKSRRKVRPLWPGGLPHDLALVDLADHLVSRNPGAIWRTEREVASERQRLARQGVTSAVAHRPDGLLVVNGTRIGIELELSKKTEPDAYARICRWYAEQVDIDGLRWYTYPGAIWARISLEIERHDLGRDVGIEVESIPSCVTVRQWA